MNTSKAMFRFMVAFILWLSGDFAARAEALPGPIPAEVLRIVDGDTLKVRAAIWIGQTVEVSVRIRGIDAPELYRPECDAEKRLALQAKSSVASAAPVGSLVSLINISPDKYGGRVVANVQIADGGSLSDYLLQLGDAVLYGEEGRWCGT